MIKGKKREGGNEGENKKQKSMKEEKLEKGQRKEWERKKLNEPRNIRLCRATALYNLKGTVT